MLNAKMIRNVIEHDANDNRYDDIYDLIISTGYYPNQSDIYDWHNKSYDLLQIAMAVNHQKLISKLLNCGFVIHQFYISQYPPHAILFMVRNAPCTAMLIVGIDHAPFADFTNCKSLMSVTYYLFDLIDIFDAPTDDWFYKWSI